MQSVVACFRPTSSKPIRSLPCSNSLCTCYLFYLVLSSLHFLGQVHHDNWNSQSHTSRMQISLTSSNHKPSQTHTVSHSFTLFSPRPHCSPFCAVHTKRLTSSEATSVTVGLLSGPITRHVDGIGNAPSSGTPPRKRPRAELLGGGRVCFLRPFLWMLLDGWGAKFVHRTESWEIKSRMHVDMMTSEVMWVGCFQSSPSWLQALRSMHSFLCNISTWRPSITTNGTAAKIEPMRLHTALVDFFLSPIWLGHWVQQRLGLILARVHPAWDVHVSG